MSDHGYPDTTTFPRVRDRASAELALALASVIERQRISKAVRGLPTTFGGENEGVPCPNCIRWLVGLDAVLEIIDGQP